MVGAIEGRHHGRHAGESDSDVDHRFLEGLSEAFAGNLQLLQLLKFISSVSIRRCDKQQTPYLRPDYLTRLAY